MGMHEPSTARSQGQGGLFSFGCKAQSACGLELSRAAIAEACNAVPLATSRTAIVVSDPADHQKAFVPFAAASGTSPQARTPTMAAEPCRGGACHGASGGHCAAAKACSRTEAGPHTSACARPRRRCCMLALMGLGHATRRTCSRQALRALRLSGLRECWHEWRGHELAIVALNPRVSCSCAIVVLPMVVPCVGDTPPAARTQDRHPKETCEGLQRLAQAVRAPDPDAWRGRHQRLPCGAAWERAR